MDSSPISPDQSPDTLVSCLSTQSENLSPNVVSNKKLKHSKQMLSKTSSNTETSPNVETPSKKKQKRNLRNNFSKSVYSIINL